MIWTKGAHGGSDEPPCSFMSGWFSLSGHCCAMPCRAVDGYTGSYSPVQHFIRDLKRAGLGSGDAFIPLQFQDGDALQFDWSEEHVVLGGIVQKIKVAHFRLCHSRKPFVMAYPGEAQEMVLDAFVRALTFYGGVPRRVIIDNPKTMVTYVSRSKDRVFHPRFLAPSRQHAAHAPAGQRMNHYVMEPVACTPASGWEKGQVENQVQFLRRQLFAPKLAFDDLESLNVWLNLQCDALGSRRHPERQDHTVDTIFSEEKADLRPLGRAFDGYVEKTVRVRSTCLVQYDSNYYQTGDCLQSPRGRYRVPARFAGQRVSLRTYASRIVVVAGRDVIAEHIRRFTRNVSYFEPWHYVPLLERKPGALRPSRDIAAQCPAGQWTVRPL